MLSRRTFVAGSARTAMSGCNSIMDIERAQSDTGPLRLLEVRVDVSDLEVATEGRSINRTTAQIQEDVRCAATAEAQKRSVPDGSPANVNVKMERVFLARGVDRVLAGISSIESVASVTAAENGAFIVEPVQVNTTAEQLQGPGPIGGVMAAYTSVEADYNNVINAHARKLLKSLDASN